MKKIIFIMLAMIAIGRIYPTNIRGRIVAGLEGDSLLPVDNINVNLIKEGESLDCANETITIKDGMFYFYAVPPGKYNIIVIRKRMLNDQSPRMMIVTVVPITVPLMSDNKSVFFDVPEIRLMK